ncbi:TraR/DksA family transcriptional regulator [Pseudomonas lundensis]|uniref:TraR/DksA family transcriptional regulator n=1 Tax=Serratia TaxID=613 RepID=UPI00157BEDE8|nr:MULTISPECIES: TraR/DksA family transcriptional regulator [Serratia]MDW5502266.1 TraR/DksA family transcriptional regulator [Serratia proteamaculans]MDW5507324.1 TraR/DksA family transcriptional regulator [Pseudomonas lundensis]
MDNIDQANERAEMYLKAQLDAATKRTVLPAAHECDECGEPIPEARRRTVPGVRLCIDCKELEELKQRTHR